jgi:A/G-specific adenine glycosylase
VASLAFDEPVGVVDGNVIRVLARVEGQDWNWWQNSTRQEIQKRADAWVQGFPSHQMNQALMELGRTICTPQSPSCLLCPLQKDCLSLKQGKVLERPKSKPRREREFWTWTPQLTVKNGKILLRRNTDVPFLRGQWLPPGTAARVKRKPKSFDYRHSITHHDIFVTLEAPIRKITKEDIWIPLGEIARYVPASLVQKAIDFFHLAGGD